MPMRRRPRRHRAPGQRGLRHGPDAPRVGRAVRLRQGPARGSAAVTTAAATRSSPPIAGPDMVVLRGSRLPQAVDGHHEDEFDVHEGEELTFSTTWFPSHKPVPAALDVDRQIAETIDAQRAVVRPVRLHRPLPGGGDPLPAGAAAAHPRRHRRHRRRTHHVPAGGLRRQPQLGLPLLLAARRLAHPRGAAGVRLRPGDPAVARLAAARHRRRPRGHADHVRRGRRPRAARARAGPPARLRRLAAGPGRQRRRRPAPDRRARRGDGRARARPAGRRPGLARLLGAAAHAGRGAGRALARARQRHLGDPRPAAALHPLPGDGVGGVRPGRRARSRSTGWTGPVERWRALRDEVREEVLDARLRPRAGHLRPALRHQRGGRLAAADPARSGSCRRTTRACSAPSGPSRRT